MYGANKVEPNFNFNQMKLFLENLLVLIIENKINGIFTHFISLKNALAQILTPE
jgi:hypothetical protein